MTYAQYGKIEATDYNVTLVGADISNVANKLNTVWSVGNNNAGYGQTAVGNVTVGNKVDNTEWDNLINTTANIATQQNSSITSVTPPVAGDKITYNSAITTNLTTIYTNRSNAASQGTTDFLDTIYGSTWDNGLSYTQTATFANGDAARYFFNAGGQLVISCSHPTGPNANATISTLATQVGNIVLSSPTSGTATIAGTSYTGVTQVGGGGSSSVATGTGYYALTTSNATILTQTSTIDSSTIAIVTKSNGTQGSYNDAGNVITFYTTWQESPNGIEATAGTTTRITAKYPSTSILSNSWGLVTLAGSVSSFPPAPISTTTTTTSSGPIIPSVVLTGPACIDEVTGINQFTATFSVPVTGFNNSQLTALNAGFYGLAATAINPTSTTIYTIDTVISGIPYALIDSGTSALVNPSLLTLFADYPTTIGAPGDDSTFPLDLPFPISFPTSANTSVSGTRIWVGTNSFVALSPTSPGTGYPPSVTNPPVPSIFIGTQDAGMFKLYGGSLDGGITYTIRWEGVNYYTQGTSYAALNRVWQCTFYAASPAKFRIDIDPVYWETPTLGVSYIKNSNTQLYPTPPNNIPYVKGGYVVVDSAYSAQILAGLATSSTGNTNTASNLLTLFACTIGPTTTSTTSTTTSGPTTTSTTTDGPTTTTTTDGPTTTTTTAAPTTTTTSTSTSTTTTTTAAPPAGPTNAIFGFGTLDDLSNSSITNLVSNAGVVATDTAGVGTARSSLAAARYGGDKAIFGFGNSGFGPETFYSLTNLVNNLGVVATDTTGVGTARANLAAAGYGGDKAIFGFGNTADGSASPVSITNLVSNTGVVATDVTNASATVRSSLAAAGYGGDKAIFGFGSDALAINYYSLTNLVNNLGVVATDTAGVGTARNNLAGATYDGDKAIFGFGQATGGFVSLTNLVSNAGVVATDTTGVGTARSSPGAAGYGGDKAIFGFGLDGTTFSATNITNLVSNTGVVAADQATLTGTARYEVAAAGFGT